MIGGLAPRWLLAGLAVMLTALGLLHLYAPAVPSGVIGAIVWQTPREPGERGLASWYGPGFHGRLTASGEVFDQHAMTAAHRELPMGTVVRVTNLENGLSVDLVVNDRGPFIDGRIIDVSRAAAEALDMLKSGVVEVRVEQVEPSRPLTLADRGA